MDTRISAIKEILIRFGLKSPKLFTKLKRVAYLIGGLFVALTVINTSLPNSKLTEVLKIAGISGTALFAGVAFAANIPVDNLNELDKKIDKAVEKKEENI